MNIIFNIFNNYYYITSFSIDCREWWYGVRKFSILLLVVDGLNQQNGKIVSILEIVVIKF